MPKVAIAGGGLAGLASALALATQGFEVDLFEAKPFLGGRAASYPLPGVEDQSIDNCQHVLLGCCANLLDFYRRLGVDRLIRFHGEFPFLEPGGRRSVLKPARLPAPLHFAPAFFRLPFLSAAEKVAVAGALLAIWREAKARRDLDQITMLEWLREKRQPARAVERFWRPILVSAVNEELERMAAAHGFQVFHLAFLAGSGNSRMGIPEVPLSELYAEHLWARWPNLRLHVRKPVERIVFSGSAASALSAGGQQHEADYFVCALPFEKLPPLAPELGLDLTGFAHSPITGIHLWFDRPVTELPHAALLDRTIQWFFNKGDGKYLLVVVSASRQLLEAGRQQIIDLAVEQLREFLPAARAAQLVKAHVVKEVRATFSAAPGLEARRPPAATRFSNLFLAGDWTRTGWPATMEGAVRSGYLAAEAVGKAGGRPFSILLER